MFVTIRGRRYRLLAVPRLPEDRDGDCTSPSDKGRMIRYRRALRGQRKMEVLIHEMLHAALWDLDEQAVEETAHDLSRALWRMGYRETEK